MINKRLTKRASKLSKYSCMLDNVYDWDHAAFAEITFAPCSNMLQLEYNNNNNTRDVRFHPIYMLVKCHVRSTDMLKRRNNRVGLSEAR